MKIVLLGPRPELRPEIAALGIKGKVALVTAGHQEDESDDAALVTAMAVPVVNLKLHARAEAVLSGDPDLATAYHERQNRFRNIQSFYRVRLDKTDEGARMISVRYVEPELLEQEDKVSVDQLRGLDADHV